MAPKEDVMPTHETFTLTIRAEGDGVPAVVRLRGLLKECLRKYGLRCVRLTGGSDGLAIQDHGNEGSDGYAA